MVNLLAVFLVLLHRSPLSLSFLALRAQFLCVAARRSGGPPGLGWRPSLTLGRCTEQHGSGREEGRASGRQEDQEERVRADRQAKGETKGTIQEGFGQGGQGGGQGQEELRDIQLQLTVRNLVRNKV